ncbi:MAG TPA: hypothetical protein VFL14_12030 [Xanthomonadales bacterium]|nr:hypothetical protein [Xanthomonadales bacterium]
MRALAALVLVFASGTASAALEVSDWVPPARAPASQPNVAVGIDGTLHVTWIERDGAGHRLQHATFADAKFAPASTIARGADWFVNWADFPALAATKDGLFAFWLARQGGGTYAYGLRVAHSGDGAQWSDAIVPHDASATEHGFAVFWPEPPGVGIAWLDGRATAGGEGHDHHGAMQLRTGRLDGALAMANERALDVRTCDCCQVDAALAGAGPVLAYRDRSDDEVRDIVVRRRVAGEWSSPMAVFADGWKTEACPVNGPAIAARGNDVYVAWFTQAGGVPRVRLARSRDGAATFEPPIDLAEGNALGRVDVAVDANGYVWTTWLTEDDRVQRLMIGRWDGALARGKGRVLRELARGKATGFPRLAVHAGSAYVAWTEPRDGVPNVVGARVAVE